MRQEHIQLVTNPGDSRYMCRTVEGSNEVSAYLKDKDRMETRVGTPKSQAAEEVACQCVACPACRCMIIT